MDDKFVGELIFGAMLALLIASLFGLAIGIGVAVTGYIMATVWMMAGGGAIAIVSLSGVIFAYYWFTDPVE